jgi:hypothetical protein
MRGINQKHILVRAFFVFSSGKVPHASLINSLIYGAGVFLIFIG